MQDISKYTKNAQKYIRYGWDAWETDDEIEFRRIIEERNKFCDEKFTLEDFNSMIEYASDYTPECLAWMQAKERYVAEHNQNTIKHITKVSSKSLRKVI